ncbi:hypothetical protein FTX61_20690 [Nitriliruptoraceae bacterium ZYF776]|nr:hypothetical protein [Profundirhabdus halotolerans]
MTRYVRGALAAAMVIAVAACTGESEPEPLSLDRDDAGQVEDPEEPVSPPDDDQGPGDDWLPPEDVQALYASLPPLEPDPDSPVDEATQREVLAAHERLYHVTQSAYATAAADEQAVTSVMTDELARAFMQEVASYAEQGHVNRTEGTDVRWVRVIEEEEGEVVVRECSIVPPETGRFDVASGERVDDVRERPVPVLLEARYHAVETAVGWRATSVQSVDFSGVCDV